MPSILQYSVTLACLSASFLSSIIEAGPVVKRGVPSAAPSKGYNLIWSEDFTATKLNTKTWKIDTGTSYPGQIGQWGTGEVEVYTNTATNLQLKNGIFSIVPKKTISAGRTAWTSGRIETNKQDFTCAAGKKMLIQGSISLGSATTDKQQGIWPAFWALGGDFRKKGNSGWPGTGEWDIMESVNGLRQTWGIVHCGVYDAQKGITGPCKEPNGLGGSKAGISRGVFHAYGFEIDRTAPNWLNQKVTWYIDGVAQRSVTGSQVNDATAWAALTSKGYFILLDVAVGGSFPNALAGTTTPNSNTADGSAVAMNVDYVAVYTT